MFNATFSESMLYNAYPMYHEDKAPEWNFWDDFFANKMDATWEIPQGSVKAIRNTPAQATHIERPGFFN